MAKQPETVKRKRWLVHVYLGGYISQDEKVIAKSGISPEQFEIEELDELHNKIEGGPDWRTIDRIEIRYQE